MAAGGNVTRPCKECGRKFLSWASDNRKYCSVACSMPARRTGAKTHGESKTRLHEIWCHMKTRCFRETYAAYAYYGGRGITVCSEWRESYQTFRDWALANGYAPHLEIDRINTNGNYEPGNCRWATREQQMINTRKRKNARTSKFKGVSKHSQNKSWIAQLHVNGKTLNLGSFKTELAAALRYDDTVFATHGEYARLNFPERVSARRLLR